MNKYEVGWLAATDSGKPLKDVIPIANSLFKIMAETSLRMRGQTLRYWVPFR